MSRAVYLRVLLSIALLATPMAAQRGATIEHVLVRGSGDAMEVEIQTSGAPVAPNAQAISGPDRIVVDFPGALPSSALQALSVNRGALKDVRSGLFSKNPPITRVVLDLAEAQSYLVSTTPNAVVVKLGAARGAGSQVASAPSAAHQQLREAALVTGTNGSPRMPVVNASAGGSASEAANPVPAKVVPAKVVAANTAQASVVPASAVPASVVPADIVPMAVVTSTRIPVGSAGKPVAAVAPAGRATRSAAKTDSNFSITIVREPVSVVYPRSMVAPSAGPSAAAPVAPAASSSTSVSLSPVSSAPAAPVTIAKADAGPISLPPAVPTPPAQGAAPAALPSPGAAAPAAEPPKPAVSVSYENGMLSIRAEKATLSQVLFEVHLKTHAEIAIPAGAEQEQVVTNLGPGPARDVLAALLNGSPYNFIFVGDELSLERVILTRRE